MFYTSNIPHNSTDIGAELTKYVKDNLITEARILLEAGAETNVSIDEKTKFYPLHYAVQNNNPEMVIELLKFGAYVERKNAEGEVPIGYAAQLKYWDIVKIFIQHARTTLTTFNASTNSTVALPYAVYANQFEIAELLLKARAHTDGKCLVDNEKLPVLHCAVKINSPNMVGLLLYYGATDNEKNIQDETAIQFAARMKYWECVKAFACHTLDPHDHGKYSKVLQIAVREKQFEVAHLLLNAAARTNVYAPNANEDVVYLAAQNTQPEMIALLVAHGAINNKEYNGDSALSILRSIRNKENDEAVTKCIEALYNPEKYYNDTVKVRDTRYYISPTELKNIMLWLIIGSKQASSVVRGLPFDLISYIASFLPNPNSMKLSTQNIANVVTVALAKLVVKDYKESSHYPKSKDSVKFIETINTLAEEKVGNATKGQKIRTQIDTFAMFKTTKKSEAIDLLVKHHLLAPKKSNPINNSHAEIADKKTAVVTDDSIIGAACKVFNEYEKSWHYPRSKASQHFIQSLKEIFLGSGDEQQKSEAIQSAIADFISENGGRKSTAMDLLRKYNLVTTSHTDMIDKNSTSVAIPR